MIFVLQSKKPKAVPNKVDKKAMEKAIKQLLIKRINISSFKKCRLLLNELSIKKVEPSVQITGIIIKNTNDK